MALAMRNTVFFLRRENGIRWAIMNWKSLIKDGRAIIPSSVTEIGDNAFNGCTALASIEIPDSIRKMGRKFFSAYTVLKDIFINTKSLMNPPLKISDSPPISRCICQLTQRTHIYKAFECGFAQIVGDIR